MDATEITKALVGWAVETCPDLNSVYDHEASSITNALPIAMAAVSDERDANEASGLGLEVADLGIQQAVLHVTNASLEFLVPPDDERGASERLQGFVAALAGAIRAEMRTGQITLGGRVDFCSPFWQAGYEPPFVIFDDGNKARRASFTVALAELP